MLSRREMLGAVVAGAVAATVKVTSRRSLVDRVDLLVAPPLCALLYEFHANLMPGDAFTAHINAFDVPATDGRVVASGTWADGTRAEIPLRLVRPGLFQADVTRQVRLTSWRYEWRA